MKKIFLLPVAVLLLLLGWSGCQTEPADIFTRQERSHIRFFNAYENDAVNIRLETFGQTRFLTDRLRPFRSWPQGSYLSLIPRLTSRDTSLQSRDSLRFDVTAYGIDTLLIEDYEETLSRGTFASFYVVDSMGKPIMIKTNDQFGPLQRGQAAYRFINLYPLFNTVELRSSNRDDGLDFTFSLEYLGYSGFKTVEAGRRSWLAINQRTNATIDSLSRVHLEAGGVYVVYLLNQNGLPLFDYERVN